ncbi:hypothetical protein PJ985_21165 [Streptomyces sp. ACA25]|uniref:hypothetical protein n=1 Tax=Streptomyces sp. ACA25 TaxID=3022596 RepID=UPI00230734AA|nr:hypothetical protein [Streptomyces sp. ACA25]MDB1090072.1 hypothetical protein [Streptomyces sp. ACA25]
MTHSDGDTKVRTGPGTRQGRDSLALLRVYLNDHLSGSTTGVELARRVVATQRHLEGGKELEQIASEIAEDRAHLLDIMEALELPARRTKVYAGWAVEKLSRLKFNGRVIGRSPLSSVVELEALRLGLEGKRSLWRILRRVAAHEERLDPERIDWLLDRVDRQADTVDALRTARAMQVFAPG